MPRFIGDQPSDFHVNRVLDLPPRIGVEAFNAVLRPSDGPLAVATLAVGRLTVGLVPTPPLMMIRHDKSSPLRVQRAVIKGPRLRMTVDFELVPWSARTTALCVRPVKWGPRAWPSNSQMDAACTVIAALSEQMATWLGEQLARSFDLTTVEPFAVSWRD
jgi:hypothetical protein